jgi:hypothetical protein
VDTADKATIRNDQKIRLNLIIIACLVDSFNLVPKFPTIMSLGDRSTLKPESEVEETRVFSESNTI